MGWAEPFPLMRFRSEAAGPAEARATALRRRLERARWLGGLIRGQDRADDHRHALGEALALHFGALAVGQAEANRSGSRASRDRPRTRARRHRWRASSRTFRPCRADRPAGAPGGRRPRPTATCPPPNEAAAGTSLPSAFARRSSAGCGNPGPPAARARSPRPSGSRASPPASPRWDGSAAPHSAPAARHWTAPVRKSTLAVMPGSSLPSLFSTSIDDRVVDDVLDRLRLQPHLPHRAVEVLVGIGLHGEAHLLAFDDRADVALTHRGQDLHPRQVVGDEEELRRRQAGGDGLPHVDVALDDDAVDGRVDLGVPEVALGAIERDAGRGQVGLRHLVGGLVVGDLALRDELLARRASGCGRTRAWRRRAAPGSARRRPGPPPPPAAAAPGRCGRAAGPSSPHR